MPLIIQKLTVRTIKVTSGKLLVTTHNLGKLFYRFGLTQKSITSKISQFVKSRNSNRKI